MDKQWIIYGANGYSGKLVAERAANQGYRPILAGRNGTEISKLSGELGLDSRIFDLDDGTEIAHGLKGIDLVLNCAGPFTDTAPRLVNACLEHKVHYLDISGELEVFEYCHSRKEQAEKQGIIICPGVAFDVVPTESIARELKNLMPDANTLKLGFDGEMALSPGSLLTLLKGIGNPALSLFMVRENNRLEKRKKPVYDHLAYTKNGKKHKSMAITWADLNAAYYSTSIPNIYAYIKATWLNRMTFAYMHFIRGLLRIPVIQKLSEKLIKAIVKGPSSKALENNRMHVFGEASNGKGETKRLYLNVAHGYKFTSQSALAFVDYCLSNNILPGYFTPSQLAGTDFVLGFTGCQLEVGHLQELVSQ